MLLPVALALGIEVLVRATTAPVPAIELFVGDEAGRVAVKTRAGSEAFQGDPLLGWKLRPNLRDAWWDFTLFSTDSEGTRVAPGDAGQAPAPAAEADFRMICLGDSVTFGYRVPVVWPEELAAGPGEPKLAQRPWPQELAARLRAQHPDRRIQIRALACPGYTTHQGLAWLRREIGREPLDAVTIQFGWNDTGLRGRSDAQALPMGMAPVAARRAIGASRALAQLALLLRGDADVPAARELVPRVGPDAFAENIRAMGRLAAGRGARVLVLPVIYRGGGEDPAEGERVERWNDILDDVIRAERFHPVSLPELTPAGWPDNTPLFGEPIHPGAAGHRLIADRVAETLSPPSIGAVPSP